MGACDLQRTTAAGRNEQAERIAGLSLHQRLPDNLKHVNGYHVWAVHVVKQMRKGRGVKLWRHLAQHRANEIAYIYGKRDKPDYLGKIYRKILEPICWSVGFFCEKTDWSVLYEAKET